MKIIAIVLGAIASLFVVLIGLMLAKGGWTLASLGGSWYYLLAGVGLIVGGGLLALRQSVGGLVFGGVLLVTLIWSLFEAGLAFWSLMPRLVAPLVIGLLVLLVLLMFPKKQRGLALKLNLVGVALTALVLSISFIGQYSRGTTGARGLDPDVAAAVSAVPEGNWQFWGRDSHGTRFAPFDQINADNVDQLEVAWQFQTGEIAAGGSEDQNTPMQIGDTLYLCSPTNQVIAVNADTGEEVWRHNPEIRGSFWNRCRGLGYYETAELEQLPPDMDPPHCARRIINTTIDARVFALDAATGERCPGFGEDGQIPLRIDMADEVPNFYYPTSAPTVTNGLIIIGGWVTDNSRLLEPSGVVRAFSADTGDLIWAWDLGNPEITLLPPEGETYTLGTPNVWSTPAFDAELGLVFVPIGNATPDYWGSHRTDAANEYNASVVALDITTGRERWHFRTVNHDVWDYDVPSQPMLIDFPTDDGLRPAVVQLTKRGQIFVLDRATGEPLVEVEQREVPQDPAPGEYLAATQPFSAMPTPGVDVLRERDMWGITPLDQLQCRIQFRQVRYDGHFTPPGVEVPGLQYPGNGGGSNWGSGSWDALNNQLVVTVLRVPQTVQLEPTDAESLSLDLVPNRAAEGQNGVSYRARNVRFMSEFVAPWTRISWPWSGDDEAEDEAEGPRRPQPDEDAEPAPEPGSWAAAWAAANSGEPIGIPCIAPPHSILAAVDLETREVTWEIPAGSAEVAGPWGWYSGLDLPVGNGSVAGAITTAGGLVIHADTSDGYIRAYDSRTGKVLWRQKMPVGSGAVPMTYVSPETGRQYIVISAGGARNMPQRGDHVVAYALPEGS